MHEHFKKANLTINERGFQSTWGGGGVLTKSLCMSRLVGPKTF